MDGVSSPFFGEYTPYLHPKTSFVALNYLLIFFPTLFLSVHPKLRQGTLLSISVVILYSPLL